MDERESADEFKQAEPEAGAGMAARAAAFLFSRWAAALGLLAVLAVAVGAPLALRDGGGKPAPAVGDADLARRMGLIQTTLAGIVTQTPAPERRAWVLDLDSRAAAPLAYDPAGSQNVYVQSARWLEEGRTIFASTLGFDVIGVDGRLQASLAAPPPGPYVSTLAFPILGTRTVLVWREIRGKLTVFDVDSKTERDLAPMPAVSDVSLSPDGRSLAFTRKLPDRVEVATLSLADLGEKVLFRREQADAAVCCLYWSSDSRRLLMTGGTATYSGRVRSSGNWTTSEVWDVSPGARLWVGAFSRDTGTVYEWAGAGRIFRSLGWAPGAPSVGVFIDVVSGQASPEQRFDGHIACFSPSGRYVVLLHDDGSTEVRELASSQTVMRVQALGSKGSCGWSKDEKLLLVSS